MVMPPPSVQQNRITEDEFLRLPDDGRKWELVDGEPVELPTFFDHDVISSLLLARLLPIALPLGYVTTGQSGCRMRSGNIRVPDVSFTRRERIDVVRPQPGFGVAAPDLCVEIISSTEESDDINCKVEEYFASGAAQVWHLYPEEQFVEVFTAPTTHFRRSGTDELEGGALLPGFRRRVAELFETGL